MSDYYVVPADLVAGTKARSAKINDIIDSIEAGFNTLPAKEKLDRDTISFVSDTGIANSYVVTMSQTPTSYIDGMPVVMKASAANTGACTINVDSLGAKSIKRPDETDPAAGDIPTGGLVTLRYDSDNGYFIIQSSLPNIATQAQAAQTAAETAETNAAASESAASTSETNASNSASAASTSETNAAASESAAATSETNAAASESAASTSETNAGISETNAANSASAASTSETNASNSESAASTSETNAANSESAASTSETNAAASEANAAASYDSFDDRYLGVKASDPSTDNDGNALNTGAIYFNSTTDLMKVYAGAVWNNLNAFELSSDTTPQLGGDLDTNGYVVKNGITLSKNTIDTAYTIPTGYNAMSVGPLDIDATVTINENSIWEIL